MSSCLLKAPLVAPVIQMCLICNCDITHFTGVSQISLNNNGKLCEKFRRIACRYFKFKCDDVKSENTITNENRNKTKEIDRLCEKCLPLAESFCDIYHEFSYIEQLFQWRIKEITDLIGIQIQNGNKMKENQAPKKQPSSAKEKGQYVTDFRNKFLNQGRKHFLDAVPKVKLFRLTASHDECNKISKNNQLQNQPIKVENEKGLEFQAESDSAKFTCKECGKSFSNSVKLNLHKRIHSGVKPYKCQYCEQRFTTRGNLSVHERIHSGVNPYKCTLCNKEFRYVKLFKIHQQEICPMRKKTVTKKLPEKLENVSNNKILSETEVICKFCEKSVHRHRLYIHERSHTGIKPFKCKVCGKAFSTGGNRNAHERLHSGVKPYKCDICGQTFRHTSSLNGHKRSKHGDTKKKSSCKCKVCGKTFEKASHKTIHERSHSQARPYECDECGLTFKTQGSYKIHQFCKRRFRSEGYCSMHQNKCSRHDDPNRNQAASQNMHQVQDADDHHDDTGNHFYNDSDDMIDVGETNLVKMDISSRFEQVQDDSEDEDGHDAKFILPY